MYSKLKSSKHFKKYEDPVSGVESYIFDNSAIPMTQSFYFTNPSSDKSGRYIWMYCGFPPAGDSVYGRSLGVVDTEKDTFTHYPNTMFHDASPLVDVDNGFVYYCDPLGIYRRSPDQSGELELIAPRPKFLMGRGCLETLATHLTFSADKKKLCFDATIGNRFVLGDVDLETGEYDVWREFDYRRNHAQFNPKIPDFMMFAEDGWTEVHTGIRHEITYDENGKLARIWIMKKDGEPIYIPPLYTEARHEFWSPDGKGIYYVDWEFGTIRYDLSSGKYTTVDPRGTWHAHCDSGEKYFVADENEIDGEKWYRGSKSRVHFFNKDTGKYVDIITENPALFTRNDPCRYHIDPHPQFAMNDNAVIHTTTVTGKVSLAVTDVSQLVEKTR